MATRSVGLLLKFVNKIARKDRFDRARGRHSRLGVEGVSGKVRKPEVDGDPVRLRIVIPHFGPQAAPGRWVDLVPPFEMGGVNMACNPLAQCRLTDAIPREDEVQLGKVDVRAVSQEGRRVDRDAVDPAEGDGVPAKLMSNAGLVEALEAVKLGCRVISAAVLVDQAGVVRTEPDGVLGRPEFVASQGEGPARTAAGRRRAIDVRSLSNGRDAFWVVARPGRQPVATGEAASVTRALRDQLARAGGELEPSDAGHRREPVTCRRECASGSALY